MEAPAASAEQAVSTPATPTKSPSSANDQPALPEKRTRQPRNSACQPCAALKMRCVATADGGKCERCRRMNRECIPAVPKARKRRADITSSSESGWGSMRDLDRERHEVATILPFQPSLHATSSPWTPGAEAASSSKDLWLSNPDIRHNGSKSFTALFSQGLASVSVPADVDYNYVQNMLTLFRQYAAYFPFVSSFLGADAVDMIAQRPMTTAAICVVTSASNIDMQQEIKRAFRRSLAAKTVISAETNLDVLVGLLIFLAWSHQYPSRSSQLYPDLCLLAGLAAELGLYQQSEQLHRSDFDRTLERDRAYLGCYYLCSSLSRKGLGHPSPLHWTERLRAAAERIDRYSDVPSDRTLIPLIELARAGEELQDGIQTALELDIELDYEYSEQRERPRRRNSVTYAIEMYTRAASHRLKSIKREHPALSNHPGFTAAAIEVYARQLSGSEALAHASPSASTGTTAVSPSTSSSPDPATLIQCACLIKEYLDDVHVRPAAVLHQMSIVDWTDLLAVLVQMARVASPSNTRRHHHHHQHSHHTSHPHSHIHQQQQTPQPQAPPPPPPPPLSNIAWESGALSSMLQPETIMNSICAHMASAPTGDALAPRHERLVYALREFCEGVEGDASTSGDRRPGSAKMSARGGEGVLARFLDGR